MNELGLGLTLNLNDLATAGLAKFSNALTSAEGLARGFSNAVRSAGSSLLGFGTGVLEESWNLAKAAGAFQAAIANAGFLTGATAEQLESLRSAAFDARIALLGFDATQAAKAQAILGRETGSAVDAIKELAPALTLAKYAGMGAEEGATTLARTLKAFGLNANDATHAVDMIATAQDIYHVSARDMTTSLRNVASGAALAGQSMEDSITAIGLARQILPDATQAATAVQKAFVQMANPKTVAQLQQLGVAVKDQAGNMRPLGDVIGDLTIATSHMTEAQRAQTLAHMFGARSAGGLAAMTDALSNGIKDASGNVLRGADALAYLDGALGKASGAMGRITDKELSTFDGALGALQKSLGSLKTAVGLGFTEAWTPLLAAAARAAASLAEAVGRIPTPIKTAVAAVVMLGGVLAVVVGGAMLLGTGVSLAAVAVGVALAGIALAGAGLYEAWQQNLGGIGDSFKSAVGTISLAWQAAVQLFTTGEFSGAVADELLNGNQGVMNFVTGLWLAWNRAKEFVGGIIDGFKEEIGNAGPVFEQLGAAIRRVGEAFGFLTGPNDPAKMGEAFDQAGASGKSVGKTLAGVAEAITNAITAGINIIAGFAEAWDVVSDAFSGFGDDAKDVINEIKSIGVELGLSDAASDSTASTWVEVGHRIAGVVHALVGIVRDRFREIASIIKGVVNVFAGVVEIISGIVNGDWSQIWHGMRRVVYGTVSGVIGIIGGLAGAVAGMLDALAAIVGKNLGAADKVRNAFSGVNDALKVGMGLDQPFESKALHQERAEAADRKAAADYAAASSGAYASYAPTSPNASYYTPTATPAAMVSAANQADASSGAATASQMAEPILGSIAALTAAKSGPTMLTGQINIDGHRVGEIVADVNRSNAFDSNMSVSPF